MYVSLGYGKVCGVNGNQVKSVSQFFVASSFSRRSFTVLTVYLYRVIFSTF